MTPFTIFHVVLSIAGILSGFVVLWGMLVGNRLNSWTVAFLALTAATSITGFCYFPFLGFTPGQAFGILSVILLAVAIYSLGVRQLSGVWCRVYVITALIALYLNTFVLIVQSFQKVPAFKDLSTTQLPFMLMQGTVFLFFLILGILAAIRFPAAIRQSSGS